MRKKMKIWACLIITLSGFNSSLFAADLPMKPSDALQRLIDGNARFTQDKTTSPDRNEIRRQATVSSQKPFAIVLGCSDSRVSPEIAFDQGIGDIFVVRVAGNVVSPVVLDSVEYSAIYNNSSIIVVLGHENCGAVDAVLKNNTKDVESIADLIKQGLNKFSSNFQSIPLEKAVEYNIKTSIGKLMESTVLSNLVRSGKLIIAGAYYDLKSGSVRILDLDVVPEKQQ